MIGDRPCLVGKRLATSLTLECNCLTFGPLLTHSVRGGKFMGRQARSEVMVLGKSKSFTAFIAALAAIFSVARILTPVFATNIGVCGFVSVWSFSHPFSESIP